MRTDGAEQPYLAREPPQYPVQASPESGGCNQHPLLLRCSGGWPPAGPLFPRAARPTSRFTATIERSTPGLTPRKQPQVWPPALSRGQLRHLLSVPTTSSPRRPHAAAEGGTHPHPLPPHDASGCDPPSSSAPLPHPLREPARPHDSARAERPDPSHTITHAGRPPPMWACTALGSQAVSQAPPWAILPSPRTSRPRDTRAPDRTRCGLRCPPLPPNRPPMSAGLGPREPLPPGHIHIALPPLPVSGSERAAPPPYLGGEISSPTLPAAQRSPSRRPRQGPGRCAGTHTPRVRACPRPRPLCTPDAPTSAVRNGGGPCPWRAPAHQRS